MELPNLLQAFAYARPSKIEKWQVVTFKTIAERCCNVRHLTNFEVEPDDPYAAHMIGVCLNLDKLSAVDGAHV